MALRRGGCGETGRVSAKKRERGSRPRRSRVDRQRQDQLLPPEERNGSGTSSFHTLFRESMGSSAETIATSAERAIPASAGSPRLADLAKAGASLALAVGGVILPGIPTLPFLGLAGRYVVRVFPGIERLLMSHSWCAALWTEVKIPSKPTLDRRSLWRMIGLGALFTAASLILHPPLPIVLGLEFGLIVFLGWRELDRSVSRPLGPITA
jgi:uncharacterized membrane protein YbaN (DUF454 family)